jgi:hypothetical protein
MQALLQARARRSSGWPTVRRRSVAGQVLTIQDKLTEGHDERVLALWEIQQADWQALAERLATTTGKSVEEVTVLRGAKRSPLNVELMWTNMPNP